MSDFAQFSIGRTVGDGGRLSALSMHHRYRRSLKRTFPGGSGISRVPVCVQGAVYSLRRPVVEAKPLLLFLPHRPPAVRERERRKEGREKDSSLSGRRLKEGRGRKGKGIDERMDGWTEGESATNGGGRERD